MATANNLEINYAKNFDDLMFGQRVAFIIESKGVSKAWIADKLGISKQALNYLLRHSTKPKFVDEFAELLELSPEWLETGIGRPSINNNVSIASQGAHTIPVRTKTELINSTEDLEAHKESIDFSRDNAKHVIAYKLDDNSNFPPFIQGSILIFDTKKQPVNGDYVLLIIEGDVFVRQYLVDGKNSCYKASSGDHKTFINPTAELLGVLFEARYQIN